jgi:hypothetical protein
MRMTHLLLILGVSLATASLAARPTTSAGHSPTARSRPDCGRNAALGYWMAMAEMQNPEASASLADDLERASRGDAPWDDRFSRIVDANHDALDTMRRASREPYCDWGLEYSRNAEAPIAHLVRARALARLNVLLGLQFLRQGKPAEAADAWAAGLRFSKDIASGAPLLGALYASNQMQLHMRAIERARQQLPVDKIRGIEKLVSSLPEDGFDWGAVIDVELGGVMGLQQRLVGSDDPCRDLRSFVGRGESPAEQERAVADYLGVPVERLTDRQAVSQAIKRGLSTMTSLRPQLVAAFRLPPRQSTGAVRNVVAKAKADPTLAQGWPSFARANEGSRGDLVKARASLLLALRHTKPAAASTETERP